MRDNFKVNMKHTESKCKSFLKIEIDANRNIHIIFMISFFSNHCWNTSKCFMNDNSCSIDFPIFTRNHIMPSRLKLSLRYVSYGSNNPRIFQIEIITIFSHYNHIMPSWPIVFPRQLFVLLINLNQNNNWCFIFQKTWKVTNFHILN